MNGVEGRVKHISDIIGEWGKWQSELIIFVFVIQALNSYNDMSYSFHSYETNFWCSDFPIDSNNVSDINQCFQYENNSQLCEHWIYNTSEFKKTLISEFDLVCDRSELSSITQSLYQLGFLVTGLVLSQFADKYGRKPLVWVSFVIVMIGLISCSLSVNITQYSISRFIMGLGMYGCSGTVCTTQSCGPKYRSDIYMIAGFGWVFGYVIIPGLAFWLNDFRLMNAFVIIPTILSIIWFYFLEESPRWLISNGRVERAEQTLRNILKRNKINENDFNQKFVELKLHLTNDGTDKNSTKTYSVFDLLKTQNLRKYTLIFWFIWIVIGLVYYGFSLNMSDFGGNFYITFMLSGGVELPSSLISILALRYISRKSAIISFLLIMAISSAAIIPLSDPTLKVTFALIGKFSVGAVWWVGEIFVPEVYPTVLRNTGAGSSSSFSRLGSMFSPFMKNLAAKTSLSVVMGLYAVMSSISAVLVIFLPETKGKEIPDTLDEVEVRNKTQKL